MSELDESRKNAIRYAKILGRQLAINFPEIAEDYRKGLNQVEIGNRYLTETVSSSDIKRRAARFALDDLLEESELRELGEDRRRANGVIVGTRAFQEGYGLGAIKLVWTKEEKEYLSILVNKIENQKITKNGRKMIVWDKVTDELNQQFQNNRTRDTCIREYSNLGEFEKYLKISWSEGESTGLTKLVEKYSTKSQKGRLIPQWKTIVEELNRVYNHNRNISSCRLQYANYCDKKGIKREKQPKTAWSETEKEQLVNLTKNSEHILKEGPNKGKLSWKAVTKALNKEFGTNRDLAKVRAMYYSIKNKK